MNSLRLSVVADLCPRVTAWQSRTLVVLAALCLLLPASANAQPAKPREDAKSVPEQLELIRQNLADLERRLSDQISDVETNLSDQLTDAESNLSTQLDGVQAGVDSNNQTLQDILGVVTAANVDITTELCLDQGILANLSGGGHGLIGAGWDEVLDVEANLSIDAIFGAEVGIGNQLCIQVPLYQVASAEPLSDILDFDTSEFDMMLAGVAAGARSVVPTFAAVYTALAPTPEEAAMALENVILAVEAGDIQALTRPDILLEPVIPDFLEQLVAGAPQLLADFAASPCTSINNLSPLGTIIDQNDPNLAFLCGTTARILTDTFFGIAAVVQAIKDVVDAILGG